MGGEDAVSKNFQIWSENWGTVRKLEREKRLAAK